jgi:hypothetical protein
MVSRILVTFVFAILGVLLSHKLRLPKNAFIWILLILGVFILGFVGVDTHLIAIGDFAINLNYCLQGLVLGVLVGLFYRSVNRSSIRYL